jgi:hypothetical protein
MYGNYDSGRSLCVYVCVGRLRELLQKTKAQTKSRRQTTQLRNATGPGTRRKQNIYGCILVQAPFTYK